MQQSPKSQTPNEQSHLEAARATKDANLYKKEALSEAAVVGRRVAKGEKINWDVWKPNLTVPEGGVWAKSLKKFAAGVLTSGGKSPVQFVGAIATRHRTRIADSERERAAHEQAYRERKEREQVALQRKMAALQQAKNYRFLVRPLLGGSVYF